jgi:hypothetical protein
MRKRERHYLTNKKHYKSIKRRLGILQKINKMLGGK